MDMKPFTILARETLVDSPYMPVEKQRVLLPNGTETDWFIHTTKAAVIILPITETGEIMLQKTYKHGCGEIVIEFCAGMIDEGETPLQAAHRELEEETGYHADDMIPVGNVFTNPTGSQMKYSFFVAHNCRPTGSIHLDDAEQIENFTVPNFETAQKVLLDPSTKTAVAAIAGLQYLQQFLQEKKAL